MNRLRELRKGKKLTVRDLSNKVNISYPTISRLENGETSFTSEYLEALSSFFGVSIDYLLCRVDEPNYPKLEKPLLNDFQFALYDKTKELSDKQKKDILNIIDVLTKKED